MSTPNNSAFFPSLGSTPGSTPAPTPTPTPAPEVEKVEVKVSEYDAQLKVCEEKQAALTTANEAAVKAHTELIEAQRELLRLQAS